MPFNFRELFSPQAIVRRLKAAPPLKTAVMDTVFTEREQMDLAVVGSDYIEEVVDTLPLVLRNSPAIPISAQAGQMKWYEPLPIRPFVFVSASELNNLKLIGLSGLERWAARKQELMRKVIRKTTEALACVAKNGNFVFPVKLESGAWDSYTVSYGTPDDITPGALLTSSSTVREVYDIIIEMEEAIEDNGWGGDNIIWAGKDAFGVVMDIAENFKSTAKVRGNIMIRISDHGVDVGGYLIKRMTERWKNPQTGVMTRKVGDKQFEMIDLSAGHKMPYCALDDLDANLQPLPMFIKSDKSINPSGYYLYGESKPFPIPNIKAIATSTVVA